MRSTTEGVIYNGVHVKLPHPSPTGRGRAVPFVCFADISPHWWEITLAEGAQVRPAQKGDRTHFVSLLQREKVARRSRDG